MRPVLEHNPRDHQRRDDGPDIRATVEDAGGQRAFLAREPFGDCLDAGGKICRLAKTEEWDRELERNLWENAYSNSAGAARYLKTQYEDLRRIMLELCFAK